MFDEITAPEQQGGLKGFLARHFAPVTHADVAKDEAELVASVFTALCAITAVLLFLTHHIINAAPVVVFAVLAGLLRVSVSRVAALLLLILTSLSAVLAFPAWGPWIWVAFSARATQLTFGYHRLIRSASASAPLEAGSPEGNTGTNAETPKSTTAGA